MKAEELKIGNYVSMTRKKYDESFLVVCEIREKFAVCKYPNELDDEWSYNSDIYPIPLTEDWLIKFGHESSFVNDLYEIGKLNFYIQDNICWIDAFGDSIEIKSVHQLQNLYFALTGKELTIKEIVK